MIEDLLDVTRIRQAGGLALQLGPAHMQTVVQRTLDEAATSHPERGIESTVEGDLAAPGTPSGYARWSPTWSATHCTMAAQTSRCAFAVDGNLPETVSITVSERWHHPARTDAPSV